MKGSPTRVIRSYESGVGRRNCRFVGADQLETLILNGLKTQKAEPVRAAENKLDTAYFVGNVRKIAESVAKSAIEICAENKTAAESLRKFRKKTHIRCFGKAAKILKYSPRAQPFSRVRGFAPTAYLSARKTANSS